MVITINNLILYCLDLERKKKIGSLFLYRIIFLYGGVLVILFKFSDVCIHSFLRLHQRC